MGQGPWWLLSGKSSSEDYSRGNEHAPLGRRNHGSLASHAQHCSKGHEPEPWPTRPRITPEGPETPPGNDSPDFRPGTRTRFRSLSAFSKLALWSDCKAAKPPASLRRRFSVIAEGVSPDVSKKNGTLAELEKGEPRHRATCPFSSRESATAPYRDTFPSQIDPRTRFQVGRWKPDCAVPTEKCWEEMQLNTLSSPFPNTSRPCRALPNLRHGAPMNAPTSCRAVFVGAMPKT